MDHTSTFGTYRGRKPLGREIQLGVQCVDTSGTPVAPDAAPTMLIYSSAGTLVVNKQIPPVERYVATGNFLYMQMLDSSFSAGSYYVRYNYSVSSTSKCAQDTFEVLAGGDSSGMFNSLFFLDRPGQGQDWIIGVTDKGAVTINRGPRA